MLYRDTWVNIASMDERDALKQKLMTDVKDVVIRVLSNTATFGRWPLVAGLACLWRAGQYTAAALEVTIQTEDYGEMKRLFPLLAGEDFVYVPKPLQGNNANNNGKNNNSGRNEAPKITTTIQTKITQARITAIIPPAMIRRSSRIPAEAFPMSRSRFGSSPGRQRGVVLILAMFIVVLVTSIAISTSWRFELDMTKTRTAGTVPVFAITACRRRILSQIRLRW